VKRPAGCVGFLNIISVLARLTVELDFKLPAEFVDIVFPDFIAYFIDRKIGFCKQGCSLF